MFSFSTFAPFYPLTPSLSFFHSMVYVKNSKHSSIPVGENYQRKEKKIIRKQTP
jgi:hypothetical protein